MLKGTANLALRPPGEFNGTIAQPFVLTRCQIYSEKGSNSF